MNFNLDLCERVVARPLIIQDRSGDQECGFNSHQGSRFDIFTCIVNVCQQQGDEVCHCTVESGGVMGGLPLRLLLR